MKNTAFIVLLVTLATAPAALVAAIPVKVGLYLQPPLVTLDQSGKTPQGLCIDVLNAMAAEEGWTLVYVIDTRAGIMNRLWRKEIDLMVPATRSAERADGANFSTMVLLSSHGQLYARRSLANPSLSELAGKTVAVLDGDIHYARFLENLRTAGVACQIVEMRSYEDVMDAVENQRADAGLVDHLFGEQIRREYGLEPLPLVTAPVDFHVAAPRDRNEGLLLRVDQRLAAFQANAHSVLHRSLARWAMAPFSFSAVFQSAGKVLGFLAGGLAIAIVVLRARRSYRQQLQRLTVANRQLLKSVDDHLRAEIESGNLRSWYKTLLNNTSDPILVHGVDAAGKPGKFVEVNDTACARLGYSRAELLALSPGDIEVNTGTGSAPQYAGLLSRWRNARLPDASPEDKLIGAMTSEITLRSKSGTEIPAEITSRILEHDGQPVIYCTLHDITVRRQMQQALKESERRFSDFFARSPIGVVLFNPAREITDVNQSALGMFGISDRAHFAAIHSLSVAHLAPEAQTTLLKGGTVRNEMIIDFDTVRKEKQFQSTRSGKCYFDMLITNLGLDNEFNPKGFMLQIQDVTERRRAEESLHQHERMLRQAQKMEAIGTLAGGIAHDFNNILTPIIGYTEIALMTAPPADPVRPNLDEILKASQRAKDLVRQILTFSRQTEQEIKPVRLVPLVKEVTQLLRGSITSATELKLSIATERDLVKADPIQIHQVIMNLCTNALHAIKETGGILEVGMNQATVDSRTRGALARLRYGAYVELFVRDTGHGMDRAVMDRIFEPFFTTKSSGEGTGMGLAVVHGIVTSLQGTITVESEAGRGTTFHVYLPLLDQAPDQGGKAALPLPKGTERILLVDDEPGIVAMINQMLTSLGYQVMTCMRASDALEVFREDPFRFDLVISDQIMPEMTGVEMIHELHKIRADIPAILCTGFSKSVPDQDLLSGGIKEVLMKPLVLRQLAEAIRRALPARAKLARKR